MTPDPGVLVASQAASHPDVRLGGARGIPGHGRLHAVTPLEQAGDRLDGGRAQPDVTRAGADRDHDVLDRGSAQHPDGARHGLLEGLEEGVGRGLGVGAEPVGVLDDDDAPTADARAHRRELDEVTHVVDLDRQSLGGHDLDIGVGALEGGAALAALTTALLRAEQRCREGTRRRRAARTRRPGEEPCVGHGGRIGNGLGQGGDGRLLAHEVGPDRTDHGGGRCGVTHAGSQPRTVHARWISRWISSGGQVPSTTRYRSGWPAAIARKCWRTAS